MNEDVFDRLVSNVSQGCKSWYTIKQWCQHRRFTSNVVYTNHLESNAGETFALTYHLHFYMDRLNPRRGVYCFDAPRDTILWRYTSLIWPVQITSRTSNKVHDNIFLDMISSSNTNHRHNTAYYHTVKHGWWWNTRVTPSLETTTLRSQSSQAHHHLCRTQ